MQLNDFFSPFNFINVTLFLASLIIYDALGFNISLLLKLPKLFRIVYWVIGLGLYLFIWFILHFFLPLSPQNVQQSLIIIGLVVLPVYIIRKGPLSLFQDIILFPFPLLVILFIYKPLFFLSSLPPHIWDEMAYHYYSPAQLITEKSWLFTNPFTCKCWGIYEMVPRLLETAYIITFSLTKTYATARLLHLLIYISSIFVVAKFIRDRVSLFSSIVYCFLAIYLYPELIDNATSGYIDAGAAALVNLSVIALSSYILTMTKEYLYIGAIFLSIASGIKYTTLGVLSSSLIISIPFFLIFNANAVRKINNKRYLISSFLKSTIIIILLSVLFGGYWYIKNFIITGNPIYPFVFQCKNNIPCGKQSEFFSNWSTPFEWKYYDTIKDSIFLENEGLYRTTQYGLIFGLIIATLTKNKGIALLSILLPLIVSLEIFLSKNTSGFVIRYFYHWLLFIPLALSIPIRLLLKGQKKVLFIPLILSSIYVYILYQSSYPIVYNNIINTNAERAIPEDLRNYARYRSDIFTWVDNNFPTMKHVIRWCSSKRQMALLLVSDPSIIWSSPEGLMRIFLVNCQQIILPVIEKSKMNEYITSLYYKFPNAYIASLDTCNPNKPTIDHLDYELTVKRHYELNQKLICSRQEIIPHLYQLN